MTVNYLLSLTVDLFMPEFLRCDGFYFAVAVCHSQLHVGETLCHIIAAVKQLCLKDEPLCNSHRKRILKSNGTHHDDDACVFFYQGVSPVSSCQSNHEPADSL